MEIKNVENEIQNNYPKMEQISNEKLNKTIPNKWKKLGVTSFIIGIIIKGKVVATNGYDINEVNPFGGNFVPNVDVEPVVAGDIVTPSGSLLGIMQIISIIGILVSIFSILLNKLKNKKGNEQKKVKKGIKILLIVSIILFILIEIIGSFYGIFLFV